MQVLAVPVTPFHFGPGALVSAAAGRFVSFLAFCAANVLIDVESLRNMLTDQPRIHTFFHTYVGAALAALLVVVLFLSARWLAQRFPPWHIFSWRTLPVAAVALGAIIGAWSHVLFDSIMHADMTPLAPFSNANGLYRLISLTALHVACVVTGGVGAVWWLLRSNSSHTDSAEWGAGGAGSTAVLPGKHTHSSHCGHGVDLSDLGDGHSGDGGGDGGGD